MTDHRPDTARTGGLLPGIQLLRGCAALLVIIAHANGMMGYPEYFGSSPYWTHDLGVYGVAVFFSISGFIIAIVSLDRDRRPVLTTREYARRRVVRIIPFLWVAVIGYNIFTYLGTQVVEWGPAIRAFFVWPVGELKPNVVWSLRHEFLFYALFAATMLGVRQRPGLLAAWFVAPLVIWAALLPFDYATTPWHPYHNEWFRVILLGSDSGANLQLGVGFVLGMAWLRGNQWLKDWLKGGMALALLAVIAGAAIITWLPFPPGFGRTLLWSALAGITLALGIVAHSRDNWFRTLGLILGNASFSIYLVHNPALLVLLELTKNHADLAPMTLYLIVFVILATVAGIIVHHLVEKPLIATFSGKRPFFLKGLRAKPRVRGNPPV